MDILFNIILLLVGFVFLIKGADFFVVSSSSIAHKFNVSPLIIGLTLVAFGTSLPELAVSFAAALTVQPGQTADIAMGNIIGSNIANLTLILGASAIALPILVKKSMSKREFPFLIGMTILIAILGFFFQSDAQIVWWEALILLVVFAYYMFLMLTGEKEIPSEDIKIINMKKAVLLLFVGIAGVSIGGTMVTRGAEFIAINGLVTFAGMSITKATTLVGLSVVALGTSLPELVTSVVAAKKGENEIALGNVVGSNVFNTLFIVGLSGIVTPLGLNGDVLIDMIILIVITTIMILFSITKGKITKIEGWILLGIYVVYIFYIIIRALGLI